MIKSVYQKVTSAYEDLDVSTLAKLVDDLPTLANKVHKAFYAKAKYNMKNMESIKKKMDEFVAKVKETEKELNRVMDQGKKQKPVFKLNK